MVVWGWLALPRQDNEPRRALSMARWLIERSTETELGQKASKVIAAIERNSDILDLEFENAETNKHNVATALCEGYERAAQDRRASLCRERRAGFAKLAIHYLEDVVPRPADYSHRVAALEKIIAKAD